MTSFEIGEIPNYLGFLQDSAFDIIKSMYEHVRSRVYKKSHAAFYKYYYNGSLMGQTNSRSSIVQQRDAFLKQLLTFHIKRKSNNKVWQFYASKA